MTGCSSACGFCGRCTEAWERPVDPEDLRRCDVCGVPLHWTDRGGMGPIRIVSLGEFCSNRCADEASEQHALALQSRVLPFQSSDRSQR